MAVVSPSSPLRRGHEHRLDDAVALLESWDLRVDVATPPRPHRYLAGLAAERAELLAHALTDPNIRAVFCTRGGVGATELLDLLPGLLAQGTATHGLPDRGASTKASAVPATTGSAARLDDAAPVKPAGASTIGGALPGSLRTSADTDRRDRSLGTIDRVLVGFSDVTALHLALRRWRHGDPSDPLAAAAARIASIHGPNVATAQLLADSLASESNRTALHRCLFDPDPMSFSGRLLIPGVQRGRAANPGDSSESPVVPRHPSESPVVPRDPSESPAAGGGQSEPASSINLAESTQGRADRAELLAGSVSGPIVGGCLSLVTSLCGTPYLPSTRGALVFLEEVGEKPYRIERSLIQLIQAGVFNDAAGIIFGSFHDCDDAQTDLDEVLREILTPLGIPVIVGLPVGHGERNTALRLDRSASLTSGAAREVTISIS